MLVLRFWKKAANIGSTFYTTAKIYLRTLILSRFGGRNPIAHAHAYSFRLPIDCLVFLSSHFRFIGILIIPVLLFYARLFAVAVLFTSAHITFLLFTIFSIERHL
jgi:hypothetical protein